MRISQMPDIDLGRTLKYICNLCGYPELKEDKAIVVMSFLKENHGYNTDAELINAFTALASGRLDEKQDTYKSLTGMTASRVIQAYIRLNKTGAKPDELPQGKTIANDETIRLVNEYSNRMIRFDQEITEDEHRMLMDHWIGEQRKNFKSNKRVDWLTSTAFDYLERNGSIRKRDGMLQAFIDKKYTDLCTWEKVEEIAGMAKLREDMAARQSRDLEFRKMTAPSAGDPIEKVIKRIAVSIYFEHIT